MKATITQMNASQLENDWARLQAHIAAERSDLLLLPEMCFAPWFCVARQFDSQVWDGAVAAHEGWLERLYEPGAGIVVGTAPRNLAGRRINSAYCWTREGGLTWIHSKTYLPRDEGYWEADWYQRAPIGFQPTRIGGLRIGLMICTEIWFFQHAREYGRQGVQLLLHPRCTPLPTNDKWLAGGRTAAVVAGAYCLSSNHAGQANQMELGGAGWICEPDGEALATTSSQQPFVTLELDLQLADAAKSTYPRYVDDSEI
ncbi:MAG: carbon-nitrogen hydrolase family protein [Chloroflexi bacterium]|nr:carbon-nitrogen hydrolase family protein [Chloroflexota bacterium]MCY3583641.1 carbon-nitrogen hydrolase family protein [Chloroflexota bacterium]MCY3717185.1 carbon-nitrogen hydrolase family protein [Chloroflexota bacterium]MDE2651791.1 carbon-nitrogen hydrolase family protein [Chloroflexota bacterium]MYA92851.1 carbon-nitrogen hydrolase family protein [Chloroflexota bacterium]